MTFNEREAVRKKQEAIEWEKRVAKVSIVGIVRTLPFMASVFALVQLADPCPLHFMLIGSGAEGSGSHA